MKINYKCTGIENVCTIKQEMSGPEPGLFNFNFKLTNEYTTKETSSRNIQLQCNDGYELGKVKLNKNTIQDFTGQKTATFSLATAHSLDDCDIEVKEEQQLISIDYVENLNHCTTNFTGQNVIEKYPSEKLTITFTAEEGYSFKDSGAFIEEALGPETGEKETLFYPTNEKEFSFTFEAIFSNNEFGSRITINLEATDENEQQVSNFTNLYKVNNQILGQLSLERFVSLEDSEDSTTDTVSFEDMGKYINNLIEIPFSLPDDFLNEEKPIQLGPHMAENAIANIVNNYLLEIDLGSIEVPEVYQNASDYNTKIQLLLPFCDVIDLDVDYTMNSNISMKLTVNLYNGECEINITSDKTDTIFYTNTVQIGQELPFIQFYNSNVDKTIKTVFDNNVRKPTVQVKYNEPIETDFGQQTNFEDDIKNIHGYAEIDNVRIKSKASNMEMQEIKTLLRQGVVLP